MFGKVKGQKTNEANVLEKVEGELSNDELPTKKPTLRMQKKMVAAQIQEAIDEIDESFKGVFLDNDFIVAKLDELRSENYNKLTYKKRLEIFANIAAWCSANFGEGAIRPSVAVSDREIDGEYLFISDTQLYITKEILQSKDMGLHILSCLIKNLRIYLTSNIIDKAYVVELPMEDLKGLARIYYENKAESVLNNSWQNFIKTDQKNHHYQPLIFDALKLSADITFQHLKMLYKKYQQVDKECSSLVYTAMNFYDTLPQAIEKRKQIIKANRENVKNYDKDIKLYDKYLDATVEDFSTFSDDQFFELFNDSYFNALNLNEDGMLTIRLENMSNELLKRAFYGFNLEGIEFPKYTMTYDEENQTMLMTRKYMGEEGEEFVETSGEIFMMVLTDISYLAQKNNLVRFANEEEKRDWYDMVEWCKLKDHVYDNTDKEIVNDGLNIIIRKVTEVLSDLQIRINQAISKSDFLPHGQSMIRGDSKDAYYDFHEFKNGLTRKEVQDVLIGYIREDMKKIKRKGGR